MNITIVGDQAERLEIIRQLLDETANWKVSVLPLDQNETTGFSTAIHHIDVALVDLEYVSKPAPIFIRHFKKQYPDTRLIGLHFYENMKLVRPLLEAGLDGYLHSSSNKNTMVEAVNYVSMGKEFILGRN